MSGTNEDAYRAMWLEWSEHWWKETANPLHIWRAMAFCLNAEPALPIPPWCMPYLAKSAANIELLMSGRDFRLDQPRLGPKEAHSLAMEALNFGRQGSKSAFTKVIESSDLQRHAMEAARGHDAIAAIKDGHPMSDDRAKRLLAKGKRLARQR